MTGGRVTQGPRSALTLRLVLAVFGLVVCAAAAVLFGAVAHSLVWCVIFAVLAAIAIPDIIVVIRRKRRGEPG